MYDVGIIGGGTAGLTAALYVLRASKTALVFERESFGGQIVLTNRIDNFPACEGISGTEYALRLNFSVISAGGDFLYADVKRIEKTDNGFSVITDNSETECKKIIIASGLKPRKLDIPNEEKLTGHGVSYCAVCDGMFYKDKRVLVVGGGESAIGYCEYLSKIAKTVTLVHRRDEFRVINAKERLRKLNNISLELNTNITALNGEQKLESVTLSNGKTLESDGLFIALGHIPDNERFKDFVCLSPDGFIITDENMKTKTDGIFAAGDCRNKSVRQLTTAAADGTIAATYAIKN